MTSSFEIDDIKKVYSAFLSLCDYIEENVGCGKCPLYDDMCGAKDKTSVEDFARAMARIRAGAGIPNP